MSDEKNEKSSATITSVIPSTTEEQTHANSLIEKFEAFSIKHARPNLDLEKLSEHQVDKVLDIMDKNESNAYDYHCKRLKTVETIQLAEITSKSSGQRTLRIVFIGIVIAGFILTLVILLAARDFFIPWLTFITGIFSGLGLSKVGKMFSGGKSKISIVEEDKTDDKDE